MNTKALKQKILDLAIHGKLLPLHKVEKIRKEEPASVLLEKIRADRTVARACGSAKKGELKKDKKDSFIFLGDDKRHYEKFSDGSVKDIEDEIPFEVPEGWSWCRLGEICEYGKCTNVNSSSLNANDWILDLEDIEKETGRIIAFHSFKDRKSESTKHKFYKGQVLYSKLRPYLNKVVIAPKDGFCTSEIIPLDFNGILISRYAQIVLMSSYFLTTVNMITYGVKMPRLGTEDAKKLFFPLPPLAEQQLIVAEIEKIFAQIDLLEQNKTYLQTAIKQAKSKILDLAIHGKLLPLHKVEKIRKEEPASVLLEKIRAEKAEKIKKGELKADKKDSFIFVGSDKRHYEKFADGSVKDIEDEIPFDVPDGWSWCRLGEICELYDGEKINKKLPYLDAKHFRKKGTDYVDFGKFVKANSYLILVDGENSGEIFFNTIDGIQGSTFKILNIQESICKNFILHFIRKNQLLLRNSKVGSATPHLNKKLFKELFLPLPPLTEQQRIVSKIEELFSLLDSLENNLV